MKVMITGNTGFPGCDLLELLMEMEGLEIYGVRCWRRNCAIFWTTGAESSPISRRHR